MVRGCHKDPHRPRVQAQSDELCPTEVQIVEHFLRDPTYRPIHLLEVLPDRHHNLRIASFSRLQKRRNIQVLADAERLPIVWVHARIETALGSVFLQVL